MARADPRVPAPVAAPPHSRLGTCLASRAAPAPDGTQARELRLQADAGTAGRDLPRIVRRVRYSLRARLRTTPSPHPAGAGRPRGSEQTGCEHDPQHTP